jgi:hypothetical protein
MIWNNENLFLITLQSKTLEIFSRLPDELSPEIFLLGLNNTNKKNSVSILPRSVSAIPFYKVFDVANNNDFIDEEDIDLSAVKVQHHLKNLKIRYTRKAIKEILDYNFKNKNKISFVSFPVYINDYQTYVILQLNEDIYENFCFLNDKKPKSKILSHIKLDKSFIESLVSVFLEKVSLPLYKLNQGDDVIPDIINLNPEELFRQAGEIFLTSIMASIYDIRTSYTVFELINYLASQTYEGNILLGKLLFAGENHSNINISIRFLDPINFNEKRKIRKVLEMSKGSLFLYSDGSKILGFCELKGKYNPSEQDLFTINFTGLYKWELNHDNRTLMVVENTIPNLPEPKLDITKFRLSLSEIFSNIDDLRYHKIVEIVESAIEEKLGALIVISENPEDEVARLKNQSIAVEPFDLDRKKIKSIISIDGAIFINLDCVCYGLGVILDGMAIDKGTSERGSRYNSALRYIESNKKKFFAIIISEDGMIDFSF